MNDTSKPETLTTFIGLDYDPQEEVITLVDRVFNDTMVTHIRMKDKMIRAKLIELGWTPPNET